MHRFLPISVLLAILATVTTTGATAAQAPTTVLVNVDSNEVPADGGSDGPIAISKSGRFVAFDSLANNLSGHDADGVSDIFIRDHRLGRTLLASQSSDEVGGNADSYVPSISRNGRFVAFPSQADNLVANDTNAVEDVFVRDVKKGLTFLVSQSSSEVPGNADALGPSISGNGRFVAFSSAATNLTGNDTDPDSDVFIRDLRKGRTYLVSQSSSEVPGDGNSFSPSISRSGRFVAFASRSSNLTGNDTDPDSDIFVRDLRKGRTYLVSQSSSEVASNGINTDPSISASGRFVAFSSSATNLTGSVTSPEHDIFVRDRRKGRTYLASQSSGEVPADSGSGDASISANGRFVSFQSTATNLTGNNSGPFYDVFVRDLRKGFTYLISQSSSGDSGDSHSGSPAINRNGRFVAFVSNADNLSNVDNDSFPNVFRRGRLRYS